MSKSSRFVRLPFSTGCDSHSSVQLAADSPPAADQPPPDRHDHRLKKTKKKKKTRIGSKSSSAGKQEERGGNEEKEEEWRESPRSWSSTAWCGVATEKKKKRNNPAVASNKSINAPAAGVNKFVTTIRESLSQLFVYRDDEDEVIEMEIGFPTDVKHVTHIGLDGNTTTMNGSMKDGWDHNLKPPPEIISFPSISLKQFELAMAAQAQAQAQMC